MRHDDGQRSLNRRNVMLAAALTPTLVAAPATAAAPEDAPPFGFELVLRATVDIAPTIDIGEAPLGHRRIVPITGGTFEGPRLRGTVMPGGADRQLIRRDGVKLLDALYELRTDDGAIITVRNRVIIDDRRAGPRYAVSTPEIIAPVGRYDWLNDAAFVGGLSSLRPARQAVLVTIWKLV